MEITPSSVLVELLDQLVRSDDEEIVGFAVLLRRPTIPAETSQSSLPGRAHWDVLTPRQRTIARLAAQAMTNRQIARATHISEHTVNYHLRQIFQRLGIGSRVELAQLVHVPVGDRYSQRPPTGNGELRRRGAADPRARFAGRHVVPTRQQGRPRVSDHHTT